MNQLTDEQLVILVKELDARERSQTAVIDEHITGLRASSLSETTAEAGDLADLAEIEGVRSRQHAAVAHDLRALSDIEAARARIAAGTVGSCIDCGDPIGFERLLAHPTASRCVRCQDLYEQTHLLVPDVE